MPSEAPVRRESYVFREAVCFHCGARTDASAERCSHCGRPRLARRRRTTAVAVGPVAGLLGCFVLILLLLGFYFLFVSLASRYDAAPRQIPVDASWGPGAGDHPAPGMGG
jgi:ribosomal protein L40E